MAFVIDKLMCRVLRSLGYDDGVDIFENDKDDVVQNSGVKRLVYRSYYPDEDISF